MQRQQRPILRLGHSPDPDDAFMWWPLAASSGATTIDRRRFRFELVARDIETLNALAASPDGDLDITAISCAQYPHVRDRYVFTTCGWSFGERYGPRLVARDGITLEALQRRWRGDNHEMPVIAVPGTRTTAFAVLSMALGAGAFRHEVVPFERIIERVNKGDFAAGLVIHEGQLTHEAAGLRLLLDLGQWWHQKHGLPLPLGANVIRRDLDDRFGPGTREEVAALLARSIEYALKHHEEGIDYALRFGRGLPRELAKRFVAMYVNRMTIDLGQTGRQAVERFFECAAAAGVLPKVGRIEFIEPSQPRMLAGKHGPAAV